MDTDKVPEGSGGGEAGEHRTQQRHRVLKAGKIILNSHNSTVNVMVRDLSPFGVRIKLADAWVVPDRFELDIQNPGSGTHERYVCEKRWQRGLMAGARFIDPNGTKPA